MTVEDAHIAAARSVLDRVLPTRGATRGARFDSLVGGTRRRSWLVTLADGRRAVLRMPEEHSHALLDVVTEARAMDAAAGAGIAPAVIAADADSGALLAEYRTGRRWTAQDVRLEDNLDRLVVALRTLHALPTELPAFAAERIASRYLGELSPAARRSRTVERWGEELLALARRHDAHFAPTSFCHNDLAAGNILDDGRLALVDFEYAARADPLLDLANLAVMNGLDAGEQRTVLRAYRNAAPTDADIAVLAWLVRMVRLMSWFWAVLGDAKANDSSLYAPYLAELAAQLQQE